ncbi:hypothetical protein AA309_07345 [Microvirga vignae]|uniref:Uncharacterized protein n=1 Tax=Microvirga vignae TaxID=1225564 RepID=A0A0H1REP2_9HYPH|nr:hypothetical protein [Microvirga vignae]KLK93663.1 hypothetical protein AA309_07345 [Microvirga vignae]
MPQTTVATGTFPSRKAADQAVQRLVSSGFARNSIELHRHDEDEGYDLEIHTRAENVKRAQRLIRASVPMSAMSMRSMGQMASGAVQTARSHPLILLGAGFLAGFVIYNLIPRASQEQARGNSPSRSGQRSKRARHR